MIATSIEENVTGEVLQRLKRIESKIIRGFESIGVDTYESSDWLSVDESASTINVTTMGRSIQVINDAAKKHGAKVGQVYKVVWRGKAKVTLEIY